MLYRQTVPSAVEISCPAETKASGPAIRIKITIFILRLGKCEDSRSLKTWSACDRHSDTRWQLSFNSPAMKCLFVRGPQLHRAQELRVHGSSPRQSWVRAWRLSTGRLSTWRCQHCSGV